jgi:hypothetical protein
MVWSVVWKGLLGKQNKDGVSSRFGARVWGKRMTETETTETEKTTDTEGRDR